MQKIVLSSMILLSILLSGSISLPLSRDVETVGIEKRMENVPCDEGSMTIGPLFPFSASDMIYNDSSKGLPDEHIWRADLAVGDMNNDGWVDIVHSGPRKPFNYGLYAWKNLGNGSWKEYKTTAHLRDGGTCVGDIDNDGYLDVAVGCHGTSNLETYKGKGDMNFSRYPNSPPGIPNEDGGYFDTCLGDVDNDGDLDLGATTFYGGGLGYWSGDGTGNWTLAKNGLPNGVNEHTYSVLFDDFNSDGSLDLFTAFGNGMDMTTGNMDKWVFERNSTGFWSDASDGMNLPNVSGYDVSTADFDNDGNRDMVLVHEFLGGANVCTVFLGDGNGNWSRSQGLAVSDSAACVEAGDLDNDGNEDVVLLAHEYRVKKTHLFIYRGLGNGRFSRVAGNYSYDETPYGLDLADVDHNGYLDIILSTGKDTTGLPGGIHILKQIKPRPSSPFVNIHYPRGGETFRAGGIRDIHWVSGRNDSGLRVDLEYSLTGSNGPFLTIAKNISDSSLYQWLVPNTPSRNCRIRIKLLDGTSTPVSNVSIGNFTIISRDGYRGYLTLLIPNGGEIFGLGQNIVISWFSVMNASISNPTTVFINYSASGPNGPFIPIGQVVMSRKGPFIFNWTIPGHYSFSNDSYISIEAREPDLGLTLGDLNDNGFFLITPHEVLDSVEIVTETNVTDVGKSLSFSGVARNIIGGDMSDLVEFHWSIPGDLCFINDTSEHDLLVINTTTAGEGTIFVRAVFLVFDVNASETFTVLEVLSDLEVTPVHIEAPVGDTIKVTVRALNPFGKVINPLVDIFWTGETKIAIMENTTFPTLKEVMFLSPGQTDVDISAKFREVHLNRTIHLTSLAYFSAFEVLPEELMLKHGETVHMTSRVFDHNLNEVTGSVEPNWTVASGPGELRNTLGGDNYFTAVEPGGGKILVSVEYYNEKLEKIIPYLIRPVLKNVDLGELFQKFTLGTETSIDAVVLDSAGNDITSECNASWELFGPGSLGPGSHPLKVVYSPIEIGVGRIKVNVDWCGDSLSHEINFEVVHNLSRVDIIGVPDLLPPGKDYTLYAAVYSMEGEEITDYCEFHWDLEADCAEITFTSGDRMELFVRGEGQGNITVTASYMNKNVTCREMFTSRHPLQRVEIDPDQVTMFNGEVISIHIGVFNTADRLINDNVSYIWSYDDTTLSTVSSNSTYLVLRAEKVGIQLVTFKVSYFGASLIRELEVEVLTRPELKRVEIRGPVADVKVDDIIELELFLFDGNGEPFLHPFEATWSVSTGSLNNTSGTVVHFETISRGEVVIDVQVVSEFGSAQSTFKLNVLEAEGDGGGIGVVLWLIVILALIFVLAVVGVFGYLYLKKRSKDVEDESPPESDEHTDQLDDAPPENRAVPDQDLTKASEEAAPHS